MAGKKRKKARQETAADAASRRQYAALPYRNRERLEIMLVSSRETRRWVLPKGWPMKGKKPHAVAATEALEEAGLLGKIAKKPVGSYHYIKRMSNGAALACEVDVFPFRVQKQRKNWREQDQRLTSWFEAAEAAHLVDEPELSDILLTFARPSREDEAEQAVVTLESVNR
ncbi:MAG: NUDIX hydrolase [Hyphomicrobiales bacterium]|nr:NUDIX hydrolase [Hyphomicrobiales bacterium]